MAYRFHGKAHVDPSNPQAWAVCDRCNNWFLHSELQWQFQYAGPNLQNIRLLVCHQCYDTPQPQLKPRILPPDPVPVMNARPEYFYIDNNDFLATNAGQIMATNDGLSFVTWKP